MLSHHYVLRKSVVFIVDSDFRKHNNLANSQIRSCFNNLDDEDYFGFITLGKNIDSDSFVLEKKARNTEMKLKYLEMTLKNIEGRDGAKMGRLHKALDLALEWQNSVEDTRETVDNHVYYGPHKWIICLLGSDDYNVQNFIGINSKMIEKT